MNYYEELGLTPRASNEEIREAYRGLARLLHPDQQQEERLRRLAESQMKRLNETHAVLADVSRRRQYDLSLVAREVQVTAARRRRNGRRFWELLGALGAASVLSYFVTPAARRQPPALQPGSHPEATVSVTAARPPATAGQRSAARSIRPFRHKAEGLGELVEPGLGTPPPPGLATPEPPQPPTLALALEPPVAPPEQPAEPPNSTVAGAWVYVPPKAWPEAQGLYPPEFIETVIVEEGGTLHGRYWARYRIGDRPISPEVAFRFEGRAGRDEASLAWTGPGGAKGEVNLKLISSNFMEIKWIATDLGAQMGLASGTAVLVRRRER